MEIIFHAHHAVISDRMRTRAERAVRGAAKRFALAHDAVVRFEGDGPQRRVEVLLHATGGRRIVAEGFGRYYGPALAQAVTKLKNQAAALKRTRRERARRLARRLVEA